MKTRIIIGLVLSLSLFAAIDAALAQPKAERAKIIKRDDWGANKPVGEGKKHDIKFITIHHTATTQKPDGLIGTKMRNLQAFSQREDKLDTGKLKPAWFDIPYHYYIAADGQIAEGREIKYAGDTNTEYDPTGHALIVLEGNFNEEQPTPAQIETLKQTVAWLARKYKVQGANVKGHSDYAKTACPGENLKKLIAVLRNLAG